MVYGVYNLEMYILFIDIDIDIYIYILFFFSNNQSNLVYLFVYKSIYQPRSS